MLKIKKFSSQEPLQETSWSTGRQGQAHRKEMRRKAALRASCLEKHSLQVLRDQLRWVTSKVSTLSVTQTPSLSVSPSTQMPQRGVGGVGATQ